MNFELPQTNDESNNLVTEKEKYSQDALAISSEIEKWADEHAEFAMGYSFEDAVKEIIEKHLEKSGKNPDDIDWENIIKHESDTQYEDSDGPDDGNTHGKLVICEEEIPFSSSSDGFGFKIEIESEELKEKINRVLEKMQNRL